MNCHKVNCCCIAPGAGTRQGALPAYSLPLQCRLLLLYHLLPLVLMAALGLICHCFCCITSSKQCSHVPISGHQAVVLLCYAALVCYIQCAHPVPVLREQGLHHPVLPGTAAAPEAPTCATLFCCAVLLCRLLPLAPPPGT